MTNKIESVTLSTTNLLTDFLSAIDTADTAEVTRFNATESAVNMLKLLRNQYATLQDGRSKDKEPAAGELPAVIYLSVIEGMYNKKKAFAEVEKVEFTLKYESYRDFQVRSLKYYIETGELLNNKKSTLQERAMVAISKLEKKAAAEAKAAKAAKAKAAKAAKAKAAKAAADKAKAEAKAAEAKAKADKLAEAAEAAADNINTKDEAEAFLNTIEQSEAAADDAEAKAAEAKAKAEAEAAAAKAEAEAAAKAKAAADKLAEAKAKAAALTRGKADNKKAEPSLDFKTLNFSQDCKDTAAMLLTELEKDASAPEMLYLAKLILDKYNK